MRRAAMASRRCPSSPRAPPNSPRPTISSGLASCFYFYYFPVFRRTLFDIKGSEWAGLVVATAFSFLSSKSLSGFLIVSVGPSRAESDRGPSRRRAQPRGAPATAGQAEDALPNIVASSLCSPILLRMDGRFIGSTYTTSEYFVKFANYNVGSFYGGTAAKQSVP